MQIKIEVIRIVTMRFLKILVVAASTFAFSALLPQFAQARQIDATEAAVPKASEVEMVDGLSKLTQGRFLPETPLYFFISIKENIQRFFQPNAAAKSKWDLTLAGKRLKEAYLMAQKNDVKGAAAALDRYQVQIDDARVEFQKAKAANQNTESLSSEMATQLYYQQSVLAAFLTKLPGDPRSATQRNVFKAARHLNNAVQMVIVEKPSVRDQFEKRMNEGIFTPPPGTFPQEQP